MTAKRLELVLYYFRAEVDDGGWKLIIGKTNRAPSHIHMSTAGRGIPLRRSRLVAPLTVQM